jgi:hypothetical protein
VIKMLVKYEWTAARDVRSLRLPVIVVALALLCGCGRSLEDEMRAKAAAMAATSQTAEAEKVKPVPEAESRTDEPLAPQAVAPLSPPSAPVRATALPKVELPVRKDGSQASSSTSQKIAVQPLPPEEALARSVQNLERIAAGLLAYVEDRKALPNAATVVTRGEQEVPLLSWRVRLLPYLGYEDLYRQFHLNEAWNSPHNKKLLAQIPAEYQSPDRLDTSTNYVVPVGAQTAFSGGRGRIPANFTGGAENVVMLLEADDTHATPWTAPQDLSYQAAAPRAGLGTLRGDGFLVALANGDVGRVSADVADSRLRELFSIEEDSTPAGTLVRAAGSRVIATAANTASTVSPPTSERSDSSSGVEAEIAATALPATTIDLSKFIRTPEPRSSLPEQHLLQAARTMLGDVYRVEYERAQTVPARRALVRRLLSDSQELTAKPAEYYELLRVTRDLAVSVGLINEALEAVRLLEERFEVDGPAMRAKTLGALRKVASDPAEARSLAAQAELLLRQSLQEDDFATAQQAHEIYVAVLRAGGDRKAALRAEGLGSMIEAMRSAYSEVPQAIDTLGNNPDHDKANAIIGRYYCAVKQRWDEFLPLLAKGDDVALRVVATIDLENNSNPEVVLQLADQYWNLADESPSPFDIGLKWRAVHHYTRSLDNHPGGLAKLRAQKRLQQWRERPEWANVLQPIGAATSAPETE